MRRPGRGHIFTGPDLASKPFKPQKHIEKRMVLTSAPGKLILLGEHAVVFGQPAIAVAINLRIRCRIERADATSMNGLPFNDKVHPYVSSAISKAWEGGPLAIQTDSDLPSGSGMGSSAAVTVSMLRALHEMKCDGIAEKGISLEAFEVESLVQGRASPIDTSASTHGKGVFVDRQAGEQLLWRIEKDVREWYVHHCDVPPLNLVVGFTGINAATGPLVAKVKRFVDRSGFAKDLMAEIGGLTLEGKECLRRKDQVRLGELMTKDHRLLAILGVSSKELDKLVKAALPYSYGAKLTGAGGGGSMIALTDDPVKVSEVLRAKGAIPYAVEIGADGARVELKE
jgi:mevalonate kinase